MNATTEPAFAAEAETYRRELQLHCYRMLGSFDESEDLVQETYLRAWRARDGFEGRSSLRAWLYRIATNACLDHLDRHPRRPSAESEVAWLQPYPDELLEGIPSAEAGPEAAVVSKETVELAFLVAIQHLPPTQRAVLIMRDVLGWSAKDTASLLDTTVASANSALQRARGTLKQRLPERRSEWPAGADASEEERKLVQRYVEATERADAEAFIEMLAADARFSMPPESGVWVGARNIVDAWVSGGFGTVEWSDFRVLVTRVNMQPAVANYVRKPGDATHRLFALDVLRIEDGKVADIVAFSTGLSALGLPAEL